MFIRIVAIAVWFCWSGGAFAQARLTHEYTERCELPCTRTAVIFVHGITGSQLTWGDPATRTYWPQLLANDIGQSSSLDVYRVDYDSRTFVGPAAVAIAQSVERQLDDLMLRKRYQRVIFVAHSLGGIITRTYLVHVKTRFGHGALSRFRLVITLGTPNEGSSLASLAQWASDNEQVRVLRPIDVNDFQQLLNAITSDIAEKHEACASLRTFAAYEELPAGPAGILGIIVSQPSATRGAFASRGFSKDHFGLAKPSSHTDPVYIWVKEAIQGCVRGNEPACPLKPTLQCPAGDFR
ncbi:esterase/lipase family protein [Bradyrhizobium sp. CCGE-LA001]|uniref:esterase/lipase family protein n=1 Tax=Bradyrhizobium sp. CCGE-LA001 TaxID=1223566 RepID=UPI0009FA22F9|nr:alpha/beta fold hydrolase [Bradyrhizobium sp. CCGE-LA001]